MNTTGANSSEDYLTHYFDIALYKWIFVISIGLFMVLFLLAFQPFGVNNFDPHFHISMEFVLIVSSFGLLVTGTLAVNEFLLRPLLLRRLTRLQLYGWLAWVFILVATVVFGFYNYLGDWHDLKWTSYLGFIRDIGMLISIPVAGFIFFIRHESLKSEFVRLQSIHLVAPASKLMHFCSDNQKDQISVVLEDLLYLESQDNYLAIVYLERGVRRTALVRTSLKRLESSLDEPVLVRCHRSFIVNLLRVRNCHGNRHGLKLGVDGADRSIPVSRSFTGSVLQKLGTHPAQA